MGVGGPLRREPAGTGCAVRGHPSGLRQPRGGRAFAAAGVARRVALEVPDIDMGAALVRHGPGVAVLPAFAVARATGPHVLDVHGTVPRWSTRLGASSTRRPSSALRALLDLVDLHVITL